MNSIRYSLILLLALSSGACAFKTNSGKKEDPVAAAKSQVLETLAQEQDLLAAQGVLTAENVKVEFTETPEPNMYTLQISWPETIRRIDLEIAGLPETTLAQTSSFQTKVRGGDMLRIKLKSYAPGEGPISTLVLQKTVPADYVVSGRFSLDKDLTIEAHRVFFLKDSQLLTGAKLLSIKTNKLIIESSALEKQGALPLESAHILTTPPNWVAQSETDLKGSTIFIQAKEARGTLKVGLIGFNGKAGRSGDEIETTKGLTSRLNEMLNGKDGEPGQIQTRFRFCNPRNSDVPCTPEVVVCTRNPTNGADGQAGASGLTGENGWNGGNPGTLGLQIEDQKEFSLEIYKRRGEPGRGGAGGKGFPGGRGGKAKNEVTICPSAANGSDGANGPTGTPGSDGLPAKEAVIEANLDRIKAMDI